MEWVMNRGMITMRWWWLAALGFAAVIYGIADAYDVAVMLHCECQFVTPITYIGPTALIFAGVMLIIISLIDRRK